LLVRDQWTVNSGLWTESDIGTWFWEITFNGQGIVLIIVWHYAASEVTGFDFV